MSLAAGRESPGIAYGFERLRRIVAPKIKVTAPAPGIVFERDVAIHVRDGTTLRANVFRPRREGRFPVLMSAHPYGKDVLPLIRRRGGTRSHV